MTANGQMTPTTRVEVLRVTGEATKTLVVAKGRDGGLDAATAQLSRVRLKEEWFYTGRRSKLDHSITM